MQIETVEEVVEEIMDKLGVYGACGIDCGDYAHSCRSVTALKLKMRIRAAVQNEQKLKQAGIIVS